MSQPPHAPVPDTTPIQSPARPDPSRHFRRFLLVNAVLLLISLLANLVLERPVFSVVHALMLAAVGASWGAAARWGWRMAKRWYLAALMPYLISFAFIGQIESFDILWMLLFPPIAAFLVERPRSLILWDATFLALVTGVYTLHWTRLFPLMYTDIALGAQLTALFFLAVISWFMQGYKAQLADVQRAFRQQLERQVDDGLQQIRGLNRELESTQTDLVRLLGELCEARSEETGNHVARVAAYARHLATLAGLPEHHVTSIHQAAPLHDVGKIAIPDRILNKPGRLTDEEFREMQSHTHLGHGILKASGRPLLQAAATIAHEHHERWDGNGYPRGLSGTGISIEGRLVAIADVFDALSFKRVYKPAWSDENIRDLFANERGRQFDPDLTDLFLGHYADFIALRDRTG
ncbi:HD domain-containing protein [Guyparkeria sp. SCN-R1]|uniref:HD-GYP domain-containing protein n=1 Tax=Guyparkeria sp. SCN-R1 TaxID=2341113 RepID=UPI000F64C645|nr:HD domain-containing phosphohydrolase [Guyparkeria sp. SCN-R1]RRQ24707.1 HD domain-containing protein [Guyparkeria sp. SCN-R1]